ncbi:MAG: family 78 glycoside hydrolase catalytic domain [Eubacterium sp.]|nr:family 78 glycoside hydrolase catalytic domain [Eubacterium sp.]
MILSDKFISASQNFSTMNKRVPAPWFKKNIQIDGDVEKAEITVCGLGFYEFFLNGSRIAKGLLSPYISNPDDIVFYDNYDIAKLLLSGDNELKFLLGNGMQNAFGGFIWDFDKASFRSSPKLAFALEITYKNGEKVLIKADESVLTQSSKILSDDLRLGEIYDAAAESGHWSNAISVSSPKGEKRISTAKPILVRDEVKPIKIWEENKSYIYDFGINTSGVCRLKINGKRGQKITLTFGEILKGGKFSYENTTFDHSADKYFQQDVYICKDGENEWKPTFTYHAFRYVKVDGIEEHQATEDLLTFVVFNTDLGSKGAFECSDEQLNTLNKMSLNSTLSNFHHFPTDCPHREKNGWTADAALSSAHTLLYFEPVDNYKQWIRCICKAQREDGALPGIVPTSGWGFDWGNGPAWDSVIVELPYQIWQKRNDITAFEICKDNIIKYVKYLETRLDSNGLLAIGLGDWCAPHNPMKAPLILTDSIEAYDIASKSAEMFGKIGQTQNADFCAEFARKIRKSIRAKLFDEESCTFKGNCQTSQAMGIYYGIIEASETEQAMAVLLRQIEETNYHIDTGVLGGRVLFHVLAEHGEIDTALKIIKAPTPPSYSQWIDAGDTALCEGFEEYEGLSSHNHHFWGNISAFFMEQICGINVRGEKIDIAPHFPESISHAKASFDSVFGKVSVKWKRENEKIIFELTCPETSKCKITFDNPDNVELKYL